MVQHKNRSSSASDDKRPIWYLNDGMQMLLLSHSLIALLLKRIDEKIILINVKLLIER